MQLARLKKRAQKAEGTLLEVQERMAQPSYASKVSEEVRAKDEARIEEVGLELQAARESIDMLERVL